MECCLTETGKICMEKLIDKALAELRHVFCFTSIANEFKEEKVWLEAEIKTLAQHAKVAAGNDKDIEADYHLWKEKAEKLVQEDILTKQKCFFGLCPNCRSRYKKGKKMAKGIEEIKQLIEKRGTFENIEIYYLSFPSRDSKYKELLDALKDDNNYMIVLQGMGGTGKTTLAKEVGKELKKYDRFAHVIDTTVSFTPNTKKIQDDIAGSLGLKWGDCNDSDRPKKLWSRLTKGEKILLIMDDVWDGGPPLDFDLIGIPNRDNPKGCRVLITTRSKQISNIMASDKMIELELLSEEEAWTMFKMYAGITNNSSKQLITAGREIAKKCKQLPVAIAVIASSLRGQQDRRHEWNASLKKPVEMDNVEDEKVGAYNCLKVSYDYMNNKKAQGLFLLSSVFPEDKEIPTEILTRLAIGTGLFGEDNGRYDEARDQVVAAKNELIDSCLLMEVNKKHVKMHDLVREVAQWIANKEIQSVNLSNKDQQSSLEKEINIKYLFCKGKDMDLFSCKYDGSKIEILIFEMERDEDRECMEVPNSFFKNFGKLQVLYFSGHDKRPLSLPDSIHSLKNVRSILVYGIDLGDISVFGYLQSLETLDLVDCKINEFPHEIANLGKLKLLNMEGCEIRRNDPFEVIGRCSTLEELYFIRSFNDFCREITLPEFKRYHIQKGREGIDDSLSKYVSFDADGGECFFSTETFKYFMQTTEGLRLNGIKEGWKNLMPEIVPIDPGMKDLVELRLSSISQLQRLIDTNGSQVPNVLSNLVLLKLEEMENLEELFNGSFSVDFLKNLETLSIKQCKMFKRLFNCNQNLCNLRTVTLRRCPMLLNLFPLLTSRNLVLLEELKIEDCEGLESIVIDDGEIDDHSHGPMFPKLRVLYIVACDRLELIFPFLSLQDFAVLEVINIRNCEKLKYVFGRYKNFEHSSLKEIELRRLPNFIGIFPGYSHSMSLLVNESSSTSSDGPKEQTQVDPIKSNIFSWICICCHGYRHKPGSMSTIKIPSVHEDSPQINPRALVSSSQPLRIWEHAECFQVQSLNLCNVKKIKLSGILRIQSVFILSITPRMLVETLIISNCDDLKHIIVDIGDDESGGRNWNNVFPELKRLYVQDCMRLEYIFGPDNRPNQNEFDLTLISLQCLELIQLPSLVAMCPKEYSTTFPSLKTLEIKRCPLVATKSIDEFIINHPKSESLDNTIIKVTNLPCLPASEPAAQITLSAGRTCSSSPCLPPSEPAQCHPVQSNIMFNLKEISLSGSSASSKRSFVFLLSNTSKMLVEILKIKDWDELKQIILDNGDDDSGGNNLFNVFPKLKKLSIKNCMQLKYIFGHYTDDHPNHNEIHLHLPALQCLKLCSLPNLIAMCPKQYVSTFSSLKELKLVKCSLDNTIIKFLIWQRAQCLPIQSHIMCNIKEMTLSGLSKIKSMFMLSITSRMLVETLRIENCDELEHIIVDIGDDESDGRNWNNVFPELKRLYVQDCVQLEYIFGHYTDNLPNKNDNRANQTEIYLHLPALQCLNLWSLPSLVAMCPKQYRTTFSSLKELELVKCSPDNTIIKDLSRSMEHCIVLESLVVHNSKVENIFCLDEIERQPIDLEELHDLEHEIERQPMNLGLQMFELHDLQNMMCLFVGPNNSFSLQNLTQIKIVQCEKLEIAFSASIFRCLSQLIHLRIENCKELKHIIKDDRQNQNLSSRTCFPKLKTLVVIKCHKLECVFPISICKELHELEALMISEAHNLKEIFKSEGDQKVEIPKLNIVVLVSLSSLFQSQGIQFQAGKNRYVQNCQELSLTSTSTPSVMRDIYHICSPIKDCETHTCFRRLFQQLDQQTKGDGNRNPSVETPKDVAVGVGCEAEATLGYKLTSSQIKMKQTLEAEHEIVENASDLETPSAAILPTNSKKFEKQQSASQQGLTNQHDPQGEINTTIKTSQEQDVDVRDYHEITKVNDNQETIKDVGDGVEIEAALGHELTS